MKVIYFLICKIYCFFISKIEKKFLQLKNTDTTTGINKLGYELLDKEIDTSKIIYEKKISINQYTFKNIVKENALFDFLKYFFLDKNIANQITKKTGYKYSIDFFTSYEISHIPETHKNKDWYANKWHIDKPFSKNTLKIIIPLNDMTSGNYGGIQIVDIYNSRKFISEKNQNNYLNFFEMNSRLNKFLIFLPNLCFHRAGNPKKNYKRNQVMIQLNPSKNWSINSNIYKKQFYIEPKFPFVNYFLDKKFLINISC